MAAGEYVSVSSQADIASADLARERVELAADPAGELSELAAIYVHRGVPADLARSVATALMVRDPLAAHARDELGMTEEGRARPVQAALSSAASFALGAALPMVALIGARAPRSRGSPRRRSAGRTCRAEGRRGRHHRHRGDGPRRSTLRRGDRMTPTRPPNTPPISPDLPALSSPTMTLPEAHTGHTPQREKSTPCQSQHPPSPTANCNAKSNKNSSGTRRSPSRVSASARQTTRSRCRERCISTAAAWRPFAQPSGSRASMPSPTTSSSSPLAPRAAPITTSPSLRPTR